MDSPSCFLNDAEADVEGAIEPADGNEVIRQNGLVILALTLQFLPIRQR